MEQLDYFKMIKKEIEIPILIIGNKWKKEIIKNRINTESEKKEQFLKRRGTHEYNTIICLEKISEKEMPCFFQKARKECYSHPIAKIIILEPKNKSIVERNGFIITKEFNGIIVAERNLQGYVPYGLNVEDVELLRRNEEKNIGDN